MASPLNESIPRRAPDPELNSNRKLIRPSLAEVRDQLARSAASAAPAASPGPRLPKKPIPPDQTNAESFYYLKQMQSKTEMVVVLRDGEQIRGVIEWYDRHCIKVHRANEPNLLVYKDMIKYMYKLEDEVRAHKTQS